MNDFDRRITPARSDLAAEHLRGTVNVPRYTSGVSMHVIAPSVRLTREPCPDSGTETEALCGENVIAYEPDNGEGYAWVQLQRDGYVGYLSREALAMGENAPSHRICVPRSFAYPAPNLKTPPLCALSLNSLVKVADQTGDYLRTREGWHIHVRHMRPCDSTEPDFVTVAEGFLGVPYLWGGKTSLGLDCSGLVQVAMQAAGLVAPRDSDQQERALGAPIAITPDLTGLQRGDLIFWKGHVGIMRDAVTLLHANGYHMLVASEPLVEAQARILAVSFGPITSIRRPERLGL